MKSALPISALEDIMTSLGMPVRDVAKTLRAAGQAGQEKLREPTRALPGPLRDLLKQSAKQADAIYERLFEGNMPSAAVVRQARAVLLPSARGLDGHPALVTSLSHAMSFGLEAQGQTGWVISDMRLAMIAAEKLADGGAHRPGTRAAVMMRGIIGSHAVFSLNDLVPTKSDDLLPHAMLATFAGLLWLSVENNSADDEAPLLTLCLDVTLASQDKVLAAHGEGEMAALITELAGVI